MAALINALDTHTPKQYGENAHPEYTWSYDIREGILQFSFQLVRTTSDSKIESLSIRLRQILTNLYQGLISHKLEIVSLSQELLTVLYKMIGHTRDIINGKGEYTLSYMMIYVWFDFFPELAKFALETFVSLTTTETTNETNEIKSIHPYGSWKDIKYFCNYCKQRNSEQTNHPLITHALSLMNGQISIDDNNNNTTNYTLAAKWTPREKSTKFGWIFNELAQSYFSNYTKTATTRQQLERATQKCKMDYRKIIANLNKKLDTVQINQCANNWRNIDHGKTTSITISKQKQAFLNVKKDGSQRTMIDDRIQCAENFKIRIKKAAAGECEIKGKRVGMNNFTTQALALLERKQRKQLDDDYQVEMDLLNSQWRDNSEQTDTLRDMIAMVDFSGSMDGEPRDCAQAIGCRIAEKSTLGKRVLSFSSNPTWHNLENCNNFTDMIEVLQNGEVGYDTNFHKALDKILDVIIEKKLAPEDVENMSLAILSDMQIHDSGGASSSPNMETLYDVMGRKYAETGMRLHGKPFRTPHIIFWNFRSTDGFPSLSSQPNVSMVSGFSPALLNHFCEKGIEAFQSCNPWTNLVEMINQPRYQVLEDKITTLLATVY
jgi:hypothetical protein